MSDIRILLPKILLSAAGSGNVRGVRHALSWGADPAILLQNELYPVAIYALLKRLNLRVDQPKLDAIILDLYDACARWGGNLHNMTLLEPYVSLSSRSDLFVRRACAMPMRSLRKVYRAGVTDDALAAAWCAVYARMVILAQRGLHPLWQAMRYRVETLKRWAHQRQHAKLLNAAIAFSALALPPYVIEEITQWIVVGPMTMNDRVQLLVKVRKYADARLQSLE